MKIRIQDPGFLREGDDEFWYGEYNLALTQYKSAKSALRQLQIEYPKRSQKYRDAEKVVQNRIYLAQAANLDLFLTNKGKAEGPKSRAAD
ncbi:hypothetical protein [Desulfobacter curvatus]|uniref:hypothetical protein n=1 Tax=Desulfobacter curvatus TaxID=2290 RepID=UPI0003610073|nr:hypothetical protein [Desulfobacter curvatus]